MRNLLREHWIVFLAVVIYFSTVFVADKSGKTFLLLVATFLLAFRFIVNLLGVRRGS